MKGRTDTSNALPTAMIMVTPLRRVVKLHACACVEGSVGRGSNRNDHTDGPQARIGGGGCASGRQRGGGAGGRGQSCRLSRGRESAPWSSASTAVLPPVAERSPASPRAPWPLPAGRQRRSPPQASDLLHPCTDSEGLVRREAGPSRGAEPTSTRRPHGRRRDRRRHVVECSIGASTGQGRSCP